jgi:hypothetical protein
MKSMFMTQEAYIVSVWHPYMTFLDLVFTNKSSNTIFLYVRNIVLYLKQEFQKGRLWKKKTLVTFVPYKTETIWRGGGGGGEAEEGEYL